MLGRNAKVDMIRRVPLFSRCSKKCLEEIAGIADEIDLPEGKQLTREGDRAREFVVLVDGTADVRQNGKLVNELSKGDFLGEIGLVTNEPRTATVTTTSPTRALVITDREFSALLRESPQISRSVIEALGERLLNDLS
ncbi:MAG TPA: cyclic nucleotide-binding domain-containing protein [Gaiellaceae bacterium]|nr:cyclic nucleotide-binding domain-containing protein [Gaiellaceae bacterium]